MRNQEGACHVQGSPASLRLSGTLTTISPGTHSALRIYPRVMHRLCMYSVHLRSIILLAAFSASPTAGLKLPSLQRGNPVAIRRPNQPGLTPRLRRPCHFSGFPPPQTSDLLKSCCPVLQVPLCLCFFTCLSCALLVCSHHPRPPRRKGTVQYI